MREGIRGEQGEGVEGCVGRYTAEIRQKHTWDTCINMTAGYLHTVITRIWIIAVISLC